eukprot:g10012.t1
MRPRPRVVGVGIVIVLATASFNFFLPKSRGVEEEADERKAEGKHVHPVWADFGEEMRTVEGATVVRRPGVVETADRIAPAHTLDFVTTLQSYFEIFRGSLLPRLYTDRGPGNNAFKAGQTEDQQAEGIRSGRFFDAVGEGNAAAARYLSPYYVVEEVPKAAGDGYEVVPAVASMADVYVNNLGYFWNEKDYVVPKSCKQATLSAAARTDLPTIAKRYEKVVVMASHWGDEYYHFVTEGLPRIMPVLDLLLEQPDVEIALHGDSDHDRQREYTYQFLELLGMGRDRITFIEKIPIFAKLAVVPEPIPCGRTNAALISALRTALLQGMYPATGGVPPAPPRPTIVLIVRREKRGLRNSDEVREALEQSFSDFDVVEFVGNGTTLSQLQIFATASIIVAPHGAGLANIVVSPLHTPVLEIAPLLCTPVYLNLSIKLQHVYGRHPSRNSFEEACQSWYEPEPDEVMAIVRDLLEAKRLADAADPLTPVNDRAEWFQARGASRRDDGTISSDYVEDDDDFPTTKFLTYSGAAEVFIYDDHFDFFSVPSIPDIKAWRRLTALTWKRVGIIWLDEKMPMHPPPSRPSTAPVDLSQPESRADTETSEKTRSSGHGVDGVMPSASSLDEHPAEGGDDHSFAMPSPEEGVMAGKRQCISCDTDPFIAASSETRLVTDDVDDVLVTAAASEESVVAGDRHDPLLTPTSPAVSLVAGDANESLGTAAPMNGTPSRDSTSEDAEGASDGEGCSPDEDHCASEESFAGDYASTDTAPWGRPYQGDATSSSLAPAEQEVDCHSVPLHPDEATAASQGAAEKTGKEMGKDRASMVAQGGRMASAWLGGEKWNMAASADPSLPPQFRKLRLLTKPPKDWECGLDGRWVPEKPLIPPRHCCRHQPSRPEKKASGLEFWGSCRRPLV